MKKIFSALMIASLTCFYACGSKNDKKAEDVQAEEVPVENVSDNTPAAIDPNAVAIGVVDLDGTTVLTPDIKVNYPLVLDFNATWCGPCQQFKPAFDAAAEKYAGKVGFISVDVDNCPEVAQAFGVSGIPHVVIIAPGKEIQNFVGTGDLLPQDKFFALIDAALK